MNRSRKSALLMVALIGAGMTCRAETSVPSPAPKDDLKELEQRFELLGARLEEIQKAQERVISLAQWVFGMLSLFAGAQVLVTQLSEKRDLKAIQEQYKQVLDDMSTQNAAGKEETARVLEQQERRTEKLMEVVQKNIGETTELFSALGGMLKLQEHATEWNAKLEQMERTQKDLAEETAAKRVRVVRELNGEAMALAAGITRRNYASRGSQEKLGAFALNLRTQRQEFGITDDELTGFCYLALARLFRSGPIEDRIAFADQGAQSARSPELWREQPDVASREGAEAAARRCGNECCFFGAILRYNIGDYKAALKLFQEAVRLDTKDFDAQMYVPEAQYLGGLAEDWKTIEPQFMRVRVVVENEPVSERFSAEMKKKLVALILVRLGNCFIGRSEYAKYSGMRSIDKALALFEEAYKLDPAHYLTQFSLAQSLWAKDQSLAPRGGGGPDMVKRYQDLFRSAFEQLHEKVASTVEGRIQMMLYYMMAICCRDGRIKGELPQTYIALIVREGSNVMDKDKVRVFSPRTKRDLALSDLMDEVREFQRTLD